MIKSTISAEGWNADTITEEKSVDNFYMRCLGPLWISLKANEIFENFIRGETLSVWTDRDRNGIRWRKNDFEDRTIKGKITVRVQLWRPVPPPWGFRSQAAIQEIQIRPLSKEEGVVGVGTILVLQGWYASSVRPESRASASQWVSFSNFKI